MSPNNEWLYHFISSMKNILEADLTRNRYLRHGLYLMFSNCEKLYRWLLLISHDHESFSHSYLESLSHLVSQSASQSASQSVNKSVSQILISFPLSEYCRSSVCTLGKSHHHRHFDLLIDNVTEQKKREEKREQYLILITDFLIFLF